MSVYANGDPVNPKNKKQKKNKKPRRQQPPRDPWAGVGPSRPGPSGTGFNPYLGYGTSFNWGGKSWGFGDQDAFGQYLLSRGVNPAQWARNHPGAMRTFDQVDQSLYGQYAPQLSQLEYERKQREAFNQRRMHDLAGFTQAVMGMLGEIAPAIRGAYGEGAETMQAGGTGYGDVLNQTQAANAAAGNSLLDVLGAPEGAHIQGGDAGGVLAGLAGWVPSTMMNAQGAAYGDAAAQLPKTASITSQMEMRSLLAEAQADDDEFRQRISETLQGLPAARQKAIQDDQAWQMAVRKQRLDELENRQQAAYKNWYIARMNGNDKEASYWKRQQFMLEQQKLAISNLDAEGYTPSGKVKPDYYYDPQYGGVLKVGTHYDPKTGRVVKDKTPGSKGSGGGKAPDWGKLQSDIATAADDYTVEKYGEKSPGDYNEAFKGLLAKFGGMVQNKAKLKRLIRYILKQKGFKVPKSAGSAPAYGGNH